MANAISKNRVHSALDDVERTEHEEMKRHGPGYQKSRESLINRRSAYKDIIDEFKKESPSKEERASLRVLRGQRRAMLRQLYPNPIIRLLRNAILLAFNLLKAIWKLAGGIVQMVGVLSAERSFNKPVNDDSVSRPLNENQQGQSEGRGQGVRDSDARQAIPVPDIVQFDENQKAQVKTVPVQVNSVAPARATKQSDGSVTLAADQKKTQPAAGNHQFTSNTTMKEGVLNRVYIQRTNKMANDTGMSKAKGI